MRKGILEQLPTALPRDRVVLVVGPEDYHGLNILKSQIQDMNRESKWIRAEFRNEVSGSQVSDKVAVLLTMVAVKHGTLANMRKAASQLDICCPNQALTVSEVKETLSVLERIRKGEAQRLDEIGNTARRSTEEFLSATRREPALLEPAETEVEPQITHSQSDIESALKTLEKFGESIVSIVEETQLAVMVVGDELKNMTAKYVDLQIQLGAKEKEIAELREDLAKANERAASESAAVQEENKKLKTENARLQKTLSSLGDLIKGAQK